MTKGEAQAWMERRKAVAVAITTITRPGIGITSIDPERDTPHDADPAIVMQWFNPRTESMLVFTYTPRGCEVRNHNGDGDNLWDQAWPDVASRPELVDDLARFSFAVRMFIDLIEGVERLYMAQLWTKAGGKQEYENLIKGL